VVCASSTFGDFHFTARYYGDFHFTTRHYGDSHFTTSRTEKGSFPTLQPSSKTKLKKKTIKNTIHHPFKKKKKNEKSGDVASLRKVSKTLRKKIGKKLEKN